MTSDRALRVGTPDEALDQAYVWIWLPGETEPVVAGRLMRDGERLAFAYGASYRARKNAIPIHEPELPLREGLIEPVNGLMMPGCIRDGSPDAWGRRVIINRLTGSKPDAGDVPHLGELVFLLRSGSDRVGALDFQESATEYVPRISAEASLEELLAAAERIEKGLPLTPALDLAINHGTSIGGARPKALVDDGERKFIAKFSASNDVYSVVKAEFMAMRLAAQCGLDVAPVGLVHAAGKEVLVIERFDRILTERGWTRRAMVTALTMFGLDEMMARYASYEDLAEIVRHRFANPKQTLEELYGRMCFNVLCGNTDDHARNHAAFWDGKMLSLTPAYDLCPQGRTGNVATQAMLIAGDERHSTLANCLSAAPNYLLTEDQAASVIDSLIAAISDHWIDACEQATLSPIDRALFAGRQFLNSYCIEGLPERHGRLVSAFEDARRRIAS